MATLADDISRLLTTTRGEPFLKRLFWELLGFDRVSQPVPFSVLAEHRRRTIAECSILARLNQVFVCHIRLSTSELRNGLEEPILDSLACAWPSVLAVFSNLSDSEMDFCWRNGKAAQNPTFRLLVETGLYGLERLAQLLTATSAYNPATGVELPALEVIDKLDRVFRRVPKRQRQRSRDEPLTAFLRGIGQSPLLSENEEEELGLRWRVDADEAARQRLICSNLRLVVHVAKDFQGRGLDLDDLIQEGCIGLILAVDRFDPTKGARLSTYAVYWIRQAVGRALLEQPLIAVPTYLFELHARWRQMKRELTRDLGFAPSSRRVDHYLGLTPKKAQLLRYARVALKTAVHRRESAAGLAALPTRRADDYPMSRMEREGLEQVIDSFLRSLPDRDATIVRHRLGLECEGECPTLEELGQRFGLTRERVRQIEAGAMELLRVLWSRQCGA